MQSSKNVFRHESLEDKKSISEVLAAITKALESGELTFSDDESDITLHPQGLMHLKVSASKEDGRNKFSLRVSWQEPSDIDTQRTLKVNEKGDS
ncbi:MAG: amphi-Trp domain-containing protein [Aestuariibacter sp.]